MASSQIQRYRDISTFPFAIGIHSVIQKSMIQPRDPLRDGTGGESIWGKEFEDEFRDHSKHGGSYAGSEIIHAIVLAVIA